ncbi:hypothetical protein OFO03_05155 [Campylobacter sp. JMF_02 ED1]|uniref:hypothetical protein n=1 Tax=unclassified Campylobacter TaxID=2593542 RepID=UPI0022E99C6F|nr:MULTISPECIES: hypothetical protein [unclassified Campylobacter]MDA3049296.1 hypothetical protein [Campylobacter sp. JMF_15 NE4]MDA3051279.1 hypothetical protein [Campylobacter sp. JMF_02 ED1]
MGDIRILNLDIGKNKGEFVDFEIKDEKLYNAESGYHLNFFAKSRINDNKITYLFDISPYTYFDEAIKEPKFSEICEFIITINGEKTDKFQGSFIDALKYIQKAFKNE